MRSERTIFAKSPKSNLYFLIATRSLAHVQGRERATRLPPLSRRDALPENKAKQNNFGVLPSSPQFPSLARKMQVESQHKQRAYSEIRV